MLRRRLTGPDRSPRPRYQGACATLRRLITLPALFGGAVPFVHLVLVFGCALVLSAHTASIAKRERQRQLDAHSRYTVN